MTTIQALVDRFLGWKLPPTFGPDAGIKFTPSNGMSREDAYAKPGWWPIGTNLFNADEARAMLEYLLGTPTRMWAIAKQHPEHTEVSMFLTSSEATAKEYERLGWTVRSVDVLPVLGVPASATTGERAAFEATFRKPAGVEWNGSTYALPAGWECTLAARRFMDQWEAWKARAALGVQEVPRG